MLTSQSFSNDLLENILYRRIASKSVILLGLIIYCATVQQSTTSCFGVMSLANCKLKTYNHKTDNILFEIKIFFHKYRLILF